MQRGIQGQNDYALSGETIGRLISTSAFKNTKSFERGSAKRRNHWPADKHFRVQKHKVFWFSPHSPFVVSVWREALYRRSGGRFRNRPQRRTSPLPAHPMDTRTARGGGDGVGTSNALLCHVSLL